MGRALALIAVLLLAGCGFKPLYGAKSAARQSAAVPAMAQIEIPPIADRTGQILRNELRDRLSRGGPQPAPLWRLDVAVDEIREDLVILRDATSTFANYTVDARWVLTRLDTDAPVLRGRARRSTSFSIATSEFATLQAQNDARDRAVASVADDIRLRLGLYFAGDDG